MINKPNIILVDDHDVFRQSLKSIITIENIATVIGEASNGAAFIDLLSSLQPDLVIMDIDMPIMNGIKATQRALELKPDLNIIVFTMFGDEEYYYKLIELGVKGFILKSSGIIELEFAIRDVMKGESYFSKELLRDIVNNFDRRITNKSFENIGFTPREKVVLNQICLGLTQEEIGQKLSISIKSVKYYYLNLMKKTGCKNNQGLIHFALKIKAWIYRSNLSKQLATKHR